MRDNSCDNNSTTLRDGKIIKIMLNYADFLHFNQIFVPFMKHEQLPMIKMQSTELKKPPPQTWGVKTEA